MQLKDLTERLFQYFTAFSGSELPVDNQTYDAQLVLEQLRRAGGAAASQGLSRA